jgi:hypothetical protein
MAAHPGVRSRLTSRTGTFDLGNLVASNNTFFAERSGLLEETF